MSASTEVYQKDRIRDSVCPLSGFEGSTSMELVLQEMSPTHEKWDVFLDRIVEYIVATWPDVLSNQKTFQEFKIEYEKELLERLKEGRRGLFLVNFGGKDIGVINAYLSVKKEQEKECICLNIAEFGVLPSERRKGYGRTMLALVEQWGRSHGATKMLIEVDKDQILANSFWGSFSNLRLDGSGERNLYYGDM